MSITNCYRVAALAAVLAVLVLAILPGAAPAELPAYVTNYGAGNVSQYTIDANDGQLVMGWEPVPSGGSPQAIAISPDGKSAYVTHDGSNEGGKYISQYTISADDGTLEAKTPPAVVTDVYHQAIAISPDGRSAYVSSSSKIPGESAYIDQYKIDADDGTLTFAGSITTGDNSISHGIAISPDGGSAYVTDSRSIVSQYSIDAEDGSLTAKTPPSAPAGRSPYAIAISPDGGSAYVTNYSDSKVSQYTINAGDRTLAPKTPPTEPVSKYSEVIAISPDGGSAYVTNKNDKNVSQFTIDASDGTLAPKTPPTVSVGNNTYPNAVAISPDGRSAYVTSYSGNVFQFTIEPVNGTLETKAPAMQAGDRPNAIAISPAPGPTATFTAQGGVAAADNPAEASAASFDASASRNASSYAWEFGDGQSQTTSKPTTTHQYQSAGAYDVTLTTSNSECDPGAVFLGSIVFTGQTAYCNGSRTSTQTEQLQVASPASPNPSTSAPLAPPAALLPSSSTSAAQIGFGSGKATLNRKGFLTVKLTCTGEGTCSGTLKLATHGKRRLKLGTKSFSIPAGQTQKVKVKISRAGRRSIKRKVKATASLASPAGQTTTATNAVTKTLKVSR